MNERHGRKSSNDEEEHTLIVEQFAKPKTSRPGRAAIITAVGAGTFVFAFQVAALLVTLPAMTAFFRPPFPVEWAITVYLLFLTGLLVLCGRIGDLLGARRLYIAGLMAFTGASLLCAIAVSPSFLLLARAVQGIGAALSAANSPAILTRNLLPEHRGGALGWQAAMTYLGLAVGASLGGYAVTHFAWRAVFLLDLPFGMIAIWLGVNAVPVDPGQAKTGDRIRVLNTILWITCLTSLLLALSRSAEWGWRSSRTLALLLFFLTALVSFVLLERESPGPLIEFSLFTSKGFSIAVLSELLLYLAVYALGFLVPILIVRGRGMAPAWAGVLLTTQSVMRMLIAPMGGVVSDWFGTRVVLAAGTTLFALGILVLACISNSGSILNLAMAMAMIGLGSGVFVPANSSRLLSHAPVHRHGSASGLLATARNLGMLLGVAIAAAAYSTSLPVSIGRVAVLSGVRTGLSIAFFAAAALLLTNCISDLGDVWASSVHRAPSPSSIIGK
jgi:EmrB/QacA subfamily drug resistance transporter